MYEMREYWETKDGRLLSISEMETSHIKNCIKMLKRGLRTMGIIGPFFLSDNAVELLEAAEDEAWEYLQAFDFELQQRRKKRK